MSIHRENKEQTGRKRWAAPCLVSPRRTPLLPEVIYSSYLSSCCACCRCCDGVSYSGYESSCCLADEASHKQRGCLCNHMSEHICNDLRNEKEKKINLLSLFSVFTFCFSIGRASFPLRSGRFFSVSDYSERELVKKKNPLMTPPCISSSNKLYIEITSSQTT